MSIAVALDDLADEVNRRGPGYLLTTTADSRPHVMQVRFAIARAELRTGVGRSAARNIAAQPAVTLVWQPETEGGYSLIVDATAVVEDGDDETVAVLTATTAVLHRPA